MCGLYKGVDWYHKERMHSSLMVQKGGSSGFVSSISPPGGWGLGLRRRTKWQIILYTEIFHDQKLS